MTCSDVRRVLPEILDDSPDGAVEAGVAGHLQNCADCSDLVSDLKLIATESRQLSEVEEPPARVWVRIAAELRAEGLIKDELALQPNRPILVPTPVTNTGRRWSVWWLVPVAAAILAAGTYTISHKPTAQVAKEIVPLAAPVASQVASTTTQTSTATPPTPTPQQLAQETSISAKSAARPVTGTEAPVQTEAPAADDQQFLRVVSTSAPSMRAEYENQLKAVNADIRETEAYVKRFPGDADARQHLMDAYQQKALLYQIALDHIQ